MPVQNHLTALRKKCAVAASALASQAGVSRQTIYAIEAGTYVPNTAVALKLARALGVTVEALFSLEQPAASAQPCRVDLLAGLEPLQPGQAVQFCRVGERTVGVPALPIPGPLPLGDGVLLHASKQQAFVQPFREDAAYAGRLLIAGCDPSVSILARHAGAGLISASCSSQRALDLLQQGKVHVAGSHLPDDLSVISRLFPKGTVKVIAFAVWEEGLVVQRGNPKHIRGVEDLARAGVVLVNREKGAGSRLLLDSNLRKLGISGRRVNGYQRIAHGHMAAAWHVSSGQADSCIATRAAARAFGLDFVPLAAERYDLVIPKQHLTLPAVQTVLDVLNRAAFRRELQAWGGYDTTSTGRLLV